MCACVHERERCSLVKREPLQACNSSNASKVANTSVLSQVSIYNMDEFSRTRIMNQLWLGSLSEIRPAEGETNLFHPRHSVPLAIFSTHTRNCILIISLISFVGQFAYPSISRREVSLDNT